VEKLSHSQILEMMEPAGALAISHRFNPPQLRFSIERNDPGPCVYAWVHWDNDHAPIILYIGKAGKDLKTRCDAHEKGFRDTKGKGSANGQQVREFLLNGEVKLYATWPQPVPFEGRLIPSHSSVEDWLLASVDCAPVINKEAAIRARADQKETERLQKVAARAAAKALKLSKTPLR
jgi:hypothetical protein